MHQLLVHLGQYNFYNSIVANNWTFINLKYNTAFINETEVTVKLVVSSLLSVST